MPVPTVITDLTSVATGNFPAGGDTVFPELDNYLRAHAGLIKTTWDALDDIAFNVKSLGAVGNGTTDDFTAIQAAIDDAVAAGGGAIYFPNGTYRLSATLAAGSSSVYFIGQSAVGVILLADHSAGAVIKLGHYFCGIKKMTIDASTARQAATIGTGAGNCGIFEINPDSASVQAIHTEISQVHVRNQPGHGIVTANFWKGNEIVRCRITDVGGHGIYAIDATGLGLSYTSTNEGRLGGLAVRSCLIYRCDGHAIATGDYPSGFSTYRVWVDDCDISFCALTAGVRRSAHAVHLYSQNALVTRCGIGGYTTAGPTATVGGIFINGRSPQVINNRFIDVLGEIVELGADADGARIIDNQIDGVVQVALNPAVKVASTCLGVTVEQGDLTFVTSLMTTAPNSSGNLALMQGLSPQGFKSARGEVTVADDAVATINLSGIVRGILVFSANSNAGKSSIHWFRVGDSNAFVAQLTSVTGVTGAAIASAPTGTSGADGSMNFFARNNANTLYVENRTGATISFTPTYLSLANGELVL